MDTIGNLPFRHLCFSSGANTDEFPQNNGTQFTNNLSIPIEAKEGDKLFIQLRSISFYTGGRKGYVKVHIEEVEPQVKGPKFSQFSGGFQIPAEIELCDGDYTMHDFIDGPFLPLRHTILEQLSVTITDINDIPLDFGQGSPTIIWIDLRKNIMEHQFLITCQSLQTDYYPTNTLSDFHCPLPTEVDASKYEVALLNIHFPHGLREEKETEAVLFVGNDAFSVNLDGVDSTLEFVRAMRLQLGTKYTQDVINITSFNTEDDGDDQMESDHRKVVAGPISIVMGSGALLQDSKMEISFNTNFRLACGQINPPPNEIIQLGNGEAYHFKDFPNIFLAKMNPTAVLTSSVIKPSLLSGKNTNMLQIIPITLHQTEEENKIYEPKRLAFHSAATFPFRIIRFRLINPDGRPRLITADNPNSSVHLTLLFRRRK